jgi:hypothetical protein
MRVDVAFHLLRFVKDYQFKSIESLNGVISTDHRSSLVALLLDLGHDKILVAEFACLTYTFLIMTEISQSLLIK